MEMLLILVIIVVSVAVGLFFAPLYIWRYTHQTARLLKQTNESLAILSDQLGEICLREQAACVPDPPASASSPCPNCGHDIPLDLGSAGKTQPCPNCGQLLVFE